MSNFATPNSLEVAIYHHQAGRWAEAEKIYRQLLAAQPNAANVLDCLGLLCGQTGRLAEGIDLVGRACTLAPNLALAWLHLGTLLQAAGHPERAIAACARAIQLEPSSAEAHLSLGTALVDLRKFSPAADSFRTAARLDPRNDRAFSNLGVALRIIGQNDQALAALKQAVEINPRSAIAQDNLGVSLRDAGDVEAALAAHARATALDPKFAIAFSNLGISLRMAERHDEALAAGQHSIMLDPSSADSYNNLGVTLGEMGRLDEAVAAYRKSLELRPDIFEAWTNLGNALTGKGQFTEALAACQRAVDINPTNPGLHFNLGLIMLSLGDFARGWKEYEWRWKCPGLYLPRPFTQPLWNGQPLNGKTILLHADQGFGDTIQFVRYVPLIVKAGGRVLLGCDRPLKRLFQGMPGLDHVFTDDGEAIPRFDVHCPVASLGAVLATTEATIPATVPYVFPKPPLVELWRHKLARFTGQLKVGLAWAGRPTHSNDRNRSLKLAQFAPLASERVTFFSLQLGPAGAEAANPPAGMQLMDFTTEMEDFADSAALVANLDLVICVDTALAHLAGALAKPVWTLIPCNPDWRWLIEREDSPWYPTMRLFRQRTMRKWDDVIERVAAALPDFRST